MARGGGGWEESLADVEKPKPKLLTGLSCYCSQLFSHPSSCRNSYGFTSFTLGACFASTYPMTGVIFVPWAHTSLVVIRATALYLGLLCAKPRARRSPGVPAQPGSEAKTGCGQGRPPGSLPSGLPWGQGPWNLPGPKVRFPGTQSHRLTRL